MGTGTSCTCLRNDIPVHPHQQKTRRLFFKGTAVSVCQGAPDFTRCAQVEAASSRGCLQKKESTIFSDGAFLERATRLELASRHPTNGNGHSREPCLTSYDFTRCAQAEAASSQGCLQKKKAPSSQMVLFWSGRRGSNSLPRPWQGRALPDELRPQTQDRL